MGSVEKRKYAENRLRYAQAVGDETGVEIWKDEIKLLEVKNLNSQVNPLMQGILNSFLSINEVFPIEG